MPIYNCIICKKQFKRRGYRKALCCSLKCKYKHTTLSRTGIPKGIKKGIYKKCEVCGKEKYIYPHRISATGRMYCSVKCRNNDPHFWDGIKGKNNHRWKGGKIQIGEYIYLKSPQHPNRHKQGGYVAEHRLVMEKKLGRYLTTNEEVHHKDQNKQNNKLQNLELVIKKAHWGEIQCPHCQVKFKIK